MRTYVIAGILAALASSLSAAVAETVDKPARVVSTVIKRAAIVEAVNTETRELKLLDAQGNRFSMTVGDEVQNFDQIEPRDRIVAEYIESVAVIVAPAGSEPLIGEGAVVAVAPKGDKPAIGSVDTTLVMGRIESINAGDRLVTVSFEGDEVRTVKVSEDARLDLVDVGDQVRLRITQALAIGVVRPED